MSVVNDDEKLQDRKLSSLTLYEFTSQLYIVFASDDKRNPLMQVGRIDLEDALVTGGCQTACVFDQHGKWICLVQQTQFPCGIGFIFRI